MDNYIATYFDEVTSLMNSVRVTNRSGSLIGFTRGVEEAIRFIEKMPASGKLMFIGNGGSAAIASHMATDFCKNGGMRAMAFNDSALLTCLGNDHGYEQVFRRPVELFADAGDILIAISSSGRSENILLGVQEARRKGCIVITLSGFDQDNPLSSLGDCNFYVASHHYGPVEVVHHSICCCVFGAVMSSKNG
jgi:D-sedoheptulose 7-phosphate isomerase